MTRSKDRSSPPWCTVLLTLGAILCHFMVYVGNLRTSEAMLELGDSTKGWSEVGLGLGEALIAELGEGINNASGHLTTAISRTLEVQNYIEVVLAVVGNHADNNTAALVELHANVPGLLQLAGPLDLEALDDSMAQTVPQGSQKFRSLSGTINKAIDKTLHQLLDQIKVTLTHFLEAIKPGLLKFGEWVVQFGDQIQNFVEAFSLSLDRSQDIMNDIMSKLGSVGENKDQMVHETFNLMDASGTGAISKQDIKDVSRLYSISALDGSGGDSLHTRYDQNGDGELTKEEYVNFVDDPAIKNIMATVLRAYARRLAEVAGSVGQSLFRDEISLQITKYFQLVCAKNQTKVTWVSDALSNGSLPVEFSADVFIQMCLAAGDPNTLTTVDIGKMVVGRMLELNSDHTKTVFELFTKVEHWIAEGFDPSHHPECQERATRWMLQSGWQVTPALLQVRPAAIASSDAMLELNASLIDALAMEARRLAERNVAEHIQNRSRNLSARRFARFSSPTSHELLMQLLGGTAPSDTNHGSGGAPSAAERIIKKGVRAQPATLQFAEWLSWNASSFAKMFQDECFVYTSESSSPLDSFATQIQEMSGRFTGALNMMQQYAGTKGFERLETQVNEFISHAGEDILKVLEGKLGGILNASADKVASAMKTGEEKVGLALGRLVSDKLSPLADTLSSELGKAVGDATHNEQAGDIIGEQLGGYLGEQLKTLTEEVIGEKLHEILNNTINQALDAATERLDDSLLLQSRSYLQSLDGQEDGGLSGAWAMLAAKLESLNNMLPLVVEAMTDSKASVARVSSNLNSVFNGVANRGPKIFQDVAKYWSLIWFVYLLLFAGMTSTLLLYAFWASGYLGGPKPDAMQDDEHTSASFGERVVSILTACCCCMTPGMTDSALCLWSMILFMQLIVLIIFVISLVLCIIGAIQAMLVSGCAQVYMLAQEKVCFETLGLLRTWLSSFQLFGTVNPTWNGVCDEHKLLTCGLLADKMTVAVTLTTSFSFLASLLSLQLIIESARLHERAVWMRQRSAEKGAF